MVRKGGSVRAKPQGHEVERREGFQVAMRVKREAGGSGLWLWGQSGEPAQLGPRRGCGRSPAGKQKPREPEPTEGCLESCVPRWTLDPAWAPTDCPSEKSNSQDCS